MKVKLLIIALLIGVLGWWTIAPSQVSAINVFEICNGTSGSEVCRSKGDDASLMIKSVINLLLYATGVSAVTMIVIGGIRYVISQGDEGKIKAAKNTILYAVIGLGVAIVAYAIVNFVIKSLG